MYRDNYETSSKSWKRSIRMENLRCLNAVDNNRTMEQDLLTFESFGGNSLQQGF